MEDKDFEVFRKNHFEISLISYGSTYECIRLATESIDVNLYSGDIHLNVFATHDVLKAISEWRPKKTFHLKYTIYKPDCSENFVAYNDDVSLCDIIFNSKYNVANENPGMVVSIHFKSKNPI